MMDHQSNSRPSPLALTQGAYFLATGVWPLMHLPSFEAVTGRKTDKWLVRTVGILVAVVGGALVSAGARGRVTPEIAALAAGTAAGLGAIDTVYGGSGRISRIYLADAAVEGLLVLAWLAAARPSPR